MYCKKVPDLYKKIIYKRNITIWFFLFYFKKDIFTILTKKSDFVLVKKKRKRKLKQNWTLSKKRILLKFY